MRKVKNMRKKRKRILAATMVVLLGAGPFLRVSATNLEDAKNKKNEAQNNLDDVKNEIEEMEDAQQGLKEEKAVYDAELVSLLTDMQILEEDIENKKEEIEQANLDLEEAKKTEQNQYQSMKVRIQYMYEVGENSVWTAIVGASSITDLLNRVEYVNEVYDYDRKLLTAYQETVQQVADLTEQLKVEKEEMEELQISYEEQEEELQNVIQELKAQMKDFELQLADAKALANEYAATIQEQNTIIAAAEEEKRRKEAEAEEKRRQEEEAANNASNNTTSTETETNSDSQSGLTNSNLNPNYTTSVSGSDVVAFASTFVGNPYVFGGTSLTNGADCSGFVQSVYANFGISLPRSSAEQRSAGQEVSYANAKAGDIICYAGHVAIYMGDGKIVHASSPSTGIKYGTATYRTILSVRRVL